MKTLAEKQTDLRCSLCRHQLIRTEVETDAGERVVGFTCRASSYDAFGVYRQCGWWLMAHDGGRKGIPRERKLKALPKLVR